LILPVILLAAVLVTVLVTMAAQPVVAQSTGLDAATQQQLARGAYVLHDVDDPQVILTSSGSEVQLVIAAQQRLESEGIRARVVSFPCWEQFEAQSASYRQAVFPAGVPVVAIEAAVPFGWERYADRTIGIDRFGASAPYETIYEKFGITADAVVAAVHDLL
jgi:transketolase